jgi:hypothetical protein
MKGLPEPVGELRNIFESKCSMKVESNSRGYNTTVHVYEGCTDKQIEETIGKTVAAHFELQRVLKETSEQFLKENT